MRWASRARDRRCGIAVRPDSTQVRGARQCVAKLGLTPISAEPLYPADDLYGIIPADTRKPFDVREIIARIVDGSELDEWKARFGTTLVSGLRAHPRHARRHPRQQRHPVLRVRAEGRALHRAVLPAAHPAGVPAEHHRLHGRQEVRERRHRAPRRQDGDRRRLRAGAEVHRHRRRQLRRRQLRHVRPRLFARVSCGPGRTRASRVMGGEQAANVLATVRRDAIEAKGGAWSADEEAAFKAPIRAQYEEQGNPYYATARLWDDGVIDPRRHAHVPRARPRARATSSRSPRRASASSGCDERMTQATSTSRSSNAARCAGSGSTVRKCATRSTTR